MKNMKIDVKYTAELARLELTEEECELFQSQLEDIVGYVEKISEVDVEGVSPMMHGREIVNAFREDVMGDSLATEVVLANAPERVGDEFLLPKIVEGAQS
jgi:aspartyl-tRNA(Asn)/glutamyl-tRNA(Gln) amidotransferase subunit C